MHTLLGPGLIVDLVPEPVPGVRRGDDRRHQRPGGQAAELPEGEQSARSHLDHPVESDEGGRCPPGEPGIGP